MIDHVSLRVSNFDAAMALYSAALAPLGYKVGYPGEGFAGFANGKGKLDFWVTATDKPTNPTHLAFRADRAGVDAFYEAALAAGAKDNGPPGLRPEYHPDYYGAFVLDGDGNNLEAVCHDPATAQAKASAKRAKAAPKAKAKAAPQAKAKAAPKAKAKAAPKAKVKAAPKAKAKAAPTSKAKPKSKGRARRA